MLIPPNYSLNLNRTSQTLSQSEPEQMLSLKFSRPNQSPHDFPIHLFLRILIESCISFSHFLMLNLQNDFCMACSNLLKHLIMQRGGDSVCPSWKTVLNEEMRMVSLIFPGALCWAHSSMIWYFMNELVN